MIVLSMFLALLPVVVIFYYVYCHDHDPEPMRTTGFAFMWGCLSVAPAFFCERAITIESKFLDAFFGIAIIEEALKLAMLMLYIWKHKDFNDSFDAIVYSVTVSLGFAAVENVMYVFHGGISVAIARAMFSIPGHATLAIVMGYFFAKAKTHYYHQRRGKQYQQLALALLVPTLLHGLFDYICIMGRQSSEWLITFAIILDLFCVILMKLSAKMDKPLAEDN